MSKRCLIVGIFLILGLVVVASCAPAAPPISTPTPTAARPPVSVPAPVPAAPARPAWEVEWGKVLEAAKREGTVSFATSAGAEPRARLSAAFKDEYGIKVESIVGLAGQIGPKILAERKAGLYLWDVFVVGAVNQSTILKPAGSTGPLQPALILPDLTDPEVIKKAWFQGRLPWVDDPVRHLIAPLLGISVDLAINTNLVKPGEIKTYDDLLNPKWKGKIILLNPAQAGSNSDASLLPMLYEIKGEEWVRKLAAQEPVIVSDDRLGNEWLAFGKYPIYMPPRRATFVEFQRAGAPIMRVETQDIEALSSLGSAVSLVDRASHPNAAKIFINWYLSKEGQTVMSKAYGTQSARLDVPIDFLEAEAIRRPDGKYWTKDREEVIAKVVEYRAKSKEIFGHLIK